MSPQNINIVTVAAVRTKAAVIKGKVGGVATELMVDSGSSVSIVRKEVLDQSQGITKIRPAPQLQLVTASGEPLQVLDHIMAPVRIGQQSVSHEFVVVNNLVTPAILGVDFLQRHKLVLDFATSPVSITPNMRKPPPKLEGNGDDQVAFLAVMASERQAKTKMCAAAAIDDTTAWDAIDECAIPQFGGPPHFEFPECPRPSLAPIVEEYKDLFRTQPGMTSAALHYIPTKGSPIRVPPRRIPAHYREEVERQIQDMLSLGIIEESSSPWMAPAVFARKKSGEIRLCVDYRELNKQTTKDAYPLPLPDEVQDRLSSSTIFSTLDLQSGYWQVPVNPDDIAKTAFCPGPGMGLYQFRRMPFGLTGAPSSFQRVMDKIFRGLPFVTTYIDDVLIHSPNEEVHKQHLRQVFQRLQETGLTLRGRKCHIGLSEVSFLGHIFSGSGMSPDPKKIKAVQDWPPPADVKAVRQFLGLASYYRWYIPCFAEIANPLHKLTQKGVPFHWTTDCADAFSQLKSKLVQAPVLAYPRFDPEAKMFVLQSDASATGIGAVLEQDGHVVAFASRALTNSERQYSVIQKECLAAVYATKQFRHYLLGRHFQLMTDHSPLQWLSSQKMEGLLCRWALALQEYDFDIIYRKGLLNSNADALSRREHADGGTDQVAITVASHSPRELRSAQQEDAVIKQISRALSESHHRPRTRAWRNAPLRRYGQLWS